MDIKVIHALQSDGCHIVCQLVCLSAIVSTEIDIDIVQFDPDLTEVRAANGNLAIVDIQVGHPYLG